MLMEEYVKKKMTLCSSSRYNETVTTVIQFFHQAVQDVCVSMVTEDDSTPAEEETCSLSAVEGCFSKLVPHILSKASPQKQFCLYVLNISYSKLFFKQHLISEI